MLAVLAPVALSITCFRLKSRYDKMLKVGNKLFIEVCHQHDTTTWYHRPRGIIQSMWLQPEWIDSTFSKC